MLLPSPAGAGIKGWEGGASVGDDDDAAAVDDSIADMVLGPFPLIRWAV